MKKTASGARAVISATSVAGRSFKYQSSSLIDTDAIVLFILTSELFVIDLHRLKVRTPLLSTALRRPECVRKRVHVLRYIIIFFFKYSRMKALRAKKYLTRNDVIRHQNNLIQPSNVGMHSFNAWQVVLI
jgi:hypothetical protein